MISYDRYDAWGDHWKQLDLGAWDEICFAFFTDGSLAAVDNYLDSQLDGIMEIAARSQIPWIAQEVTVDGDLHRRTLPPDVAFEDIEEEIYRRVFTRLREAPIAPVGIGISLGYIETPEAEAYVRAQMEEVYANGF